MEQRFIVRPSVCLVIILIACVRLPAVAADGADSPRALLAAAGHSYTVTAPGVADLQAGFSATFVTGGVRRVLYSSDGSALGPGASVTEETPYGEAVVTPAGIHFEDCGIDLLMRLGQVHGVRGVLLQAGIRNRSDTAVELVSVSPVDMAGGAATDGTTGPTYQLEVAGDLKAWLVTALNGSRDAASPVLSLGGTRRTIEVHEYGGLYRGDGCGFLFGPVGDPIAYVTARFERDAGENVTLGLSADMGGVRVNPGATRWGQQVVLLFESPGEALARWTEWVAATHGAGISPGALSGWSSWNFRGKATAGAEVQAMVAEVLASPGHLRPDVIQLESGLKDVTDPREIADIFPEGLTFYAQRIAATGARPGLVLSLKAGQGGKRYADQESWMQLVEQVRRAVDKGFTFLKLHCTGVTIRPGAFPDKTPFEVFRAGFREVRRAVGDDVYLVYLDREPNRATVGFVDASRTGNNAPRRGVRRAINDVLRSYQLNNRWFAVDNDTYYMGTEVDNLSKVTGGWPLVRTWMSMVGLSCGLAVTSDPWHWDSFKPYWRNVEVLTPPARERTEVLDLCTSRVWSRLAGRVARDWGDSTVALLWNPGRSEKKVSLEFKAAGMDPERRYAVWSFWDNRYLGIAEKSWTTPALSPSASQHLRFTPLERSSSRPVLIGSNLHIYCGAAEIERVTRSLGSMEIALTDAGARAGDLFVYCRNRPVLRAATGCVASDIAGAGENAWRVHVSNRQNGVPQLVELDILLPVTLQSWFWALVAIAAASLVFAAWRYVVDLRLLRLHALTQQRARISRDIHDDLGATLTRIVMLSETADAARESAETTDDNLRQIHEAALDMTREMDATVWAINPRNDRLDQLVMYLDAYAQEFLDPTGIESRVDFPSELPPRPVKAHVRHTLFLAVKEALANIVRHAGAGLVQIRLTVQPRGFLLSIEDDGIGFVERSEEPTRPDAGNGLINMRQRLTAIGGRCMVDSEPGRGTRVTFDVPLKG